ncbi:EutN/CcmL family microcompartment protein, partial [bacterium]|nr:EutN/CcmL family microcompartment protein [bacterium]
VRGTVVATHHEPGFHSQSLKFVEKVFDLEDRASNIKSLSIAIDRIGANVGEFVLLETAMESGLGMDSLCATDTAIVAIVDKLVE